MYVMDIQVVQSHKKKAELRSATSCMREPCRLTHTARVKQVSKTRVLAMKVIIIAIVRWNVVSIRYLLNLSLLSLVFQLIC